MTTNNQELRAALAGLAMQGLLANSDTYSQTKSKEIARAAVEYADALLLALVHDGSEPTSGYVNQD